MLVESMSEKEAIQEVMDDMNSLCRSFIRWIDEYLNERRKLNIPRNQPYCRTYKSKYKNKNPWITVIYKPDEVSHIKFMVDNFSYTWYQSPIGLRVFAIAHDSLSIYNGHLFGRYNERLNLTIGQPLARVHHFFENNRVLAPTEYERDGHKCLVGVCPTGYILGEQREDLECNVFKTFIARSNAGPRLSSVRDDLLASLDALDTQEPNPLSPQQAPPSNSIKARLRLALAGNPI
jgi:hypothetical protein